MDGQKYNIYCKGLTVTNIVRRGYASNFEGLSVTTYAELFQTVFSFVFLISYISTYDQNFSAFKNRNRNSILLYFCIDELAGILQKLSMKNSRNTFNCWDGFNGRLSERV